LSNYTIAEASVLPEPEGEDARSISRDDYVMSQNEENEMSEQQLRELYDNEEIERFIDLFSAVSSDCLILIVISLTKLFANSMSLRFDFRTLPQPRRTGNWQK